MVDISIDQFDKSSLIKTDGIQPYDPRGQSPAIYRVGQQWVADVFGNSEASDAFTVRELSPTNNAPTTLFQVLKNGTAKIAGVLVATATGVVASIAKSGSTALTGAVTLTGSGSVTLTQSGQNIDIGATGGSGGTPAVVLGTAASAGVATTFLRDDDTIVAFDTTNPAAIGSAATGAAAVASRRDHVHPTGAGTPSTQAFGDAAATGTGPAAAMSDHKHGMPAAPSTGQSYNYLTNPGCEIDQRGGSVTANAAYAHDRWLLTLAGTDTCTITDEATIVDTTSSHSLKAIVVVGTGAGASNVGQVLKNADLGAYSLKGQTVCFAIRVRTATASACKAAITTDGTGGTTTLSGFHTGGGTFETLSVSVAVPTDATTLTVKVTFAVSCTAYLDNATLVIGSSAQTYYPLTPAEEWERCQRYYEVLGGAASYIRVDFSANAANDIAQMLIFATRKAVTPTVTKAGTWTLVNCAVQPFIGNGIASTMGYPLGVSASAAGAGNYHTDSTDDLISAEANP